MNGPLLEVTDLVTSFPTERGVMRAVDGVSFNLRAGEVLGIVGESGSGKTVLARSIMGLVPSSAHQHGGSVAYAGQEVLTLPDRQRRHLWGAEMAMVFQNPMTSLNPVMTIGRQIVEPIRLHLGMSRQDAAERAVELLRRVRIPEPERRMGQYPHELSGGMRQRVVIAIAIAAAPRLLFADEPTTALDVTVQAQMMDLLRELRREQGMSIILITHDLGVVAGFADRIAVMYGGRLVETAPTRTLFTNTKMPYTMSLLRSIPDVGAPSHTRLQAIPGRPPDLTDPPSGCRFAPRCAYARDRCRREAPSMTAAESADHRFACWYPVGSPEFAERDMAVTAALRTAGEEAP